MAIVYMLSTVDNPFNPHHQFDEWMQWDEENGYHSMGLLARILYVSLDMLDTAQNDAIDAAIDEIVEENVYGVHIKVTEADEAPRMVIK